MGAFRSSIENGRVLSHAKMAVRKDSSAGVQVKAAFTSKQEALVKETWAILKKDAAHHGLALFLTVFEIAPAAKKLFSFLRDSNVPLEKNPKLKAHALQVFVIICEAATSLSKKGEVLTPGSTMKDMAHAHMISGVVDEHYDNDLFDQVIEEANEHYHQLEARMVKMQQEGLDIETTQNRDYFGALIHHLSLVRNKRCLLSYVYNRSQIVQRLRWQLGAVLPAELQEKLNFSEKEFFKGYSDLLGSYMTNINLDLTVDTTPPKDPYIQVRVMDDVGEVLLDDQSTTLLRNSIHLIKRTEAESLVSQGLLEEFIG